MAYTISPTSLVKFVEPEVPETLAKLVDAYEKKGSPELLSSSAETAPIIDVFDIENIAQRIDSDANITEAQKTHRQKVSEIEKKYEELVNKLPDNLSPEERIFEHISLEEKKANELAEAEERLCSAYWDVILPINDPQSKNSKKADRIWKKSYDTTDKDIYAQGAREGLRFVARICDNFGIDFSEVGNLTFSKEIGRRSSYSEAFNEIQFEKRLIVKGVEGTQRTAIHETAHAIERKIKNGELGNALLKLLDKISQKDGNGEFLLVKYRNSIVRVGTVQVPDLYALKDCKNENEEIICVELLSTFYQQMYVAPWLLQNKEYRKYYQEILSCIKSICKSKD